MMLRRHSGEWRRRWRRTRHPRREDAESLSGAEPPDADVIAQPLDDEPTATIEPYRPAPNHIGGSEPDDEPAHPIGARPYLLRHEYGVAFPTEPAVQLGFDSQALRESGSMIETRLEELAVQFYATLFANYPALRDHFPAGMEAQRTRLVGALVRILTMATDKHGLISYLAGLGRDHRKFGVIAEHYGPVGMALISAVRQVSGEHWTPRFERAWVQAYDTMARVMVEAADRDARVNPPWWDAEVVMHRRVLSDLAVIQVRPHTVYPYRPGQYCYVMTPRRDHMWRAYSLASAPREDGLLEFHIRSVGAGWVSSALVWRTEPGDVLRLGAPQGGEITNPASDRDLLCISGGTGIAPVLAGMQDLAAHHAGPRVHVFYAGRDRESLYALQHLETIGTRYRKLTVVPVISPEETVDRSPDTMGNIVAAYGDWHEHDVFVSGPTTMVSAAVDRLHEKGVPGPQIRWDDYGIY